MRFPAVWRLSSVWVILPLALLAAQLFTGSVFPADEGYPLADQVRALGSIALVYPLICVGAAIAAARVRHSKVLANRMHTRSRAIVGANLAAMPCAMGFLVMTLTMAMYSLTHSGSVIIAWPLLICVLVSVAAYALLGAALGLRLSGLLAIPLAVLVPYIMIAIPPALDVPWLRHLTSVNTSCCYIDQTLSMRAVSSFVLFHIALGVLSVALIAHSPRMSQPGRHPHFGYVVAAVLGVVTVWVAHPLPYGPADERSGSPTCEQTAGFDICLWPEHATTRTAIAPALKKTRAIASATGVDLPTRRVERPQQTSSWPVATVDLPSSDPTKVNESIAGALFPSSSACASSDSDAAAVSDPGGVVSSPMVARMWWLWRLTGDPQDPGTDETATATLHELQHLPDRAQGARMNALARQLQTYCKAQR